MIIGNGVLAKALQQIDDESLLLFASGVSNSLETKEEEFARELNLLQNTLAKNPGKKLFYFSTCSISDPAKQGNQYVLHKLNIEKYIQKNQSNYIIFRVGNAVGNGGNPHTLINFLSHNIRNRKEFSLFVNAKRPLIDVDDIAEILNTFKNDIQNEIINVAYPYQYSLKEIISAIEVQLGIQPVYEEILKGDCYDITFNHKIIDYFKNVNSDEYLQKVISKYVKN